MIARRGELAIGEQCAAKNGWILAMAHDWTTKRPPLSSMRLRPGKGDPILLFA